MEMFLKDCHYKAFIKHRGKTYLSSESMNLNHSSGQKYTK